MRGYSLFTGIGGIELGLRRGGLDVEFDCCELDADARTVLAEMAPHSRVVHDDVRTLARLPDDARLLTAGSPCTNFSIANVRSRHGLARPGASSLLHEVFRLLATAPGVEHVVLENVANMRTLDGGRGLRVALAELERLGYAWAYRTIDARAFGLRQRRRRLVVVARRAALGPPTWLLAEDAGPPPAEADPPFAAFSWVDGHRGSGFAEGCTPTIRAHDTPLSIPSQPAIIPLPPRGGARGVVRLVPEDGEELMGFPAGWTACLPERRRFCKLGNSVAVPVFAWVGARLHAPADPALGAPADLAAALPRAAWGGPGLRPRAARCGEFPVRTPLRPLRHLDKAPPLSARAARGFLKRARAGKPGMPDWALKVVEGHLAWSN